nr:unnamed protein product [Digitaria exilis]
MSSPPAPASGAGKRGRTSDPGLASWASLPQDLVRLVAWRLLADGDLLDYVRFRAVCTGWRSGAVSPRGLGVVDPRFHPRRWMMLPEGHCLYPGHPDLRGYARFLNLDTGAWILSRIPLLEDHLAIDSVDGLLLLLGDQYLQGTVRLLHPFTGDIVDLPPLATLLPQLGDSLSCCPVLYRIKKLASKVCASASFKDGVITVMLALGWVSRVAFATTTTSLDQKWNLSEFWATPSLAFQGKLYMLQEADGYCDNHMHQFLEIGPPVQEKAGSGGSTLRLRPPHLLATIPKSKFRNPRYLVECGSEILVLSYRGASTSRILICRLADLVQQRIVPIRSIGDNTLFLDERCISVASKEQRNSVQNESPRRVRMDEISGVKKLDPRTVELHAGSSLPDCTVT